MNNDNDIRWKQRLNNFSKAMSLLRQTADEYPDWLALDPLMQEGIIQRFEYTYELAWKTLKDKMEYDGLVLEAVSPRYVFKLAYQQQYLTNIEIWLQMVTDRNLMSHSYEPKSFKKIMKEIKDIYIPLIDELYKKLTQLS